MEANGLGASARLPLATFSLHLPWPNSMSNGFAFNLKKLNAIERREWKDREYKAYNMARSGFKIFEIN
jgi:hypothetical protein